MNTRILVIDDLPTTQTTICDVLQENLRKNDFPDPQVIWLNPNNYPADDQLLAEVKKMAASDRWDLLLVDINLGRNLANGVPELLLPFQIIEAFREENRIALAIIFSGTFEEHLRKVYKIVADGASTSLKRELGRHLNKLWGNQMRGFFDRTTIIEDVIGELRSLPCILQIERETVKNANVEIDWHSLRSGIGNPDAGLVYFKDLGNGLRKGNRISNSISNHIISYGVSAVAEIYKLQDLKITPILFVTAECDDLRFVDEVISSVKKYMPGLDSTRLQFHETPAAQLSWLRGNIAPVIVFMLHGGDGYLKGADPSADLLAAEDCRWMNSGSDRELMKGKAVYCFSCNSQTLAADAIEAGAVAFIGFPDIPFYRFDDGVPRSEPELTKSLQNLYGRLTETVLLRWFMGRDTIEQIVEFVKLTVRQMIITFADQFADHPYKADVISMFEKIAGGVMFEGNGDWVFPGE